MIPSILQKAIGLSIYSPSRYKLCAIVARKKQIISIGYNWMMKTHPCMVGRNEFPQHLHAEIHALLNSPFIDRKTILYVARTKKTIDHKVIVGTAKPCDRCVELIKEKRIQTVVYTISENEYGVLKL